MHSTLRQEGTALGLLKKLSAKPRIGNLVNTFKKQKGNKNWNEGDERVIGLVTAFNPAQHRKSSQRILKMNPDLIQAFTPDGIFVSFRGAKSQNFAWYACV